MDSLSLYCLELAGWISSNYFVVGFCVLIVGLALKWGLRAAGTFRRLDEQVLRLTGRLSGETFSPEEVSEAAGTEFPVLARAWRGYVSGLRSADVHPLGELEGYYTTKDPEEYFNFEVLAAPNIDLPFYNVVPAILTGLGILGTFVGLAGGIFLATDALGNTTLDLEMIQSSMSGLLGGASTAFFTSICGLFCSILFTGLQKRAVHKLKLRVDALNEAVSERITTVGFEEVLLASHAVALEQKMQNASFLTDWKLHMSELLENLVKEQNDGLRELFGKLSEDIGSLRESVQTMSSGQVQTLQTIFENLMKQFSSDLTGELSRISDSFETSANGINEAVDALSGVLKGMKGVVEETSEVIHGQLDRMSVVLEEMINGLEEKSKSLNETLSDTVSEVDDVSGRIVEAAEKLGGSTAGCVEAIENSAENVRKTIDGAAEDFSGSLRDSGEDFRGVVDEAGGDFSERMKEASGAIRAEVDRFNGLLSAMNETTERLSNVSADVGEGGEWLKGSINVIKGVVEDLGNFSGLINSLPERIGEVTTELEGVLSSQAANLGTQVSSSNELNRQVLDLQNETMEELAHLNEQISQNWQLLEKALYNFHGNLDNCMGDLDKHLGNALNRLSDVVSNLGAESDADIRRKRELGALLEQFNRNLAEALEDARLRDEDARKSEK